MAMKRKAPKTITTLKEKMINKSEPIMAVTMRANNDMGKPMIIARFLMFL
jgi:hypothetical protein